MPALVLFDLPAVRMNLLPITFTRPIGGIRIGILTIAEKWERHLRLQASFLTAAYLREKFPLHIEEDNLFINGRVLPDAELVKAVQQLSLHQALYIGEEPIALRCNHQEALLFSEERSLQGLSRLTYDKPITSIRYLWDIFQENGGALEHDFDLLTAGRTSQPLNATNILIGDGRVFIEQSAEVNAAVLNTSSGSIYIGEGAIIMEGSMIRGPVALCEHAVVKMSAKIYGPTTIGPYAKVGGEINNSIIFGYSNKAHDGFLGNSVVGEWCNIGADTNNSNLKNTYTSVKLWSYAKESFVDTGLQFCGLFMADHSKCGINTMFNTGTVVGVSANIFGSGFPRNFIPSFSWGGAQGFSTYRLKEALETARLMMQRRGIILSVADEKIMQYIFHHDEKFRNR